MKRRPRRQHTAKPAREALVEIEKPIYGGSFLARMEGKATFVPLTLPGEQARVRIVEEKKSFATAEPQEILRGASERVAPKCQHFGICGGCHYQHADYEAQLAYKEAILRETLTRGGINPPEKIEALAGSPWHYRNRIRIALDATGRVGYRARRSHELVPIAECPISAPLLVKAALCAGEILKAVTPAFRATEISLFTNADETEVLASIIAAEAGTHGFERLFEEWKKQIPELAGVELVREGRGGAAPEVVAQLCANSLTYRAGGVNFRVDHGAFFQVNRWLIDDLCARVTANRRGKLAWDLFSGVGLFAKKLAENFERVVAVESAPMASEALEHNLEGGVGECAIAETAEFLQAQEKTTTPDLIVVDPPRAGLGAELTSLLADVGAPAIVYVSCDPATLARDLKILLGSGYELRSVTLADLFPQTFHLESVVELHRS